MSPAGKPGMAIECATEHVEVAVIGPTGEVRAHEIEDVGHGHTRRLAALAGRALEHSAIEPRSLGWIAADLGPGSFTGVRVGLATAEALALAAHARLFGASSLAALAHGAKAKRALVVPLVPAGRRDVYAGFFRADTRGALHLLAAPRVGPTDEVLRAIAELEAVVPGSALHVIGPGAARERERIEAAHPGSTTPEWRFGGLSALDLARAALDRSGPAAGLPAAGGRMEPLYVRPAQAEERVRRRVNAATPTTLRPFANSDIPVVAAIERQVFSDPWPESFFLGELRSPLVYARIAERGGAIAGYSVAWLGAGAGHLGNLAVVPGQRRRGVANALLADLFARAQELRIESIALEVRVSNFAAQWLYRAHGFETGGLRRRYYRDTGEDALVLEWRAGARTHVAG